MRFVSILVVGSLLAACAGSTVRPADDAAAPHPLVGHWGGSWTNPKATGGVRFTVLRVVDARVEGSANIQGTLLYHNVEWPFTGTIEGNHLTGTVAAEAVRTTIYWDLTLSADGRALSGRGYSSYAAVWSRLSLAKYR